MDITIMGKPYQIEVQLHVLRNITYVLLDAPIFRAQTKTDPYPARMDDIDSAIYYSAWNQCIAEAIKRFNPDLYHINDYHGALAPVYLLPETVPCVLSLHNAEFQGLWGMKNAEEAKEVCEVYNVPTEVAQKYVQFGDVFNLLHAGASYLRIHQKGFGAVGVSKKYGKRSWARYPVSNPTSIPLQESMLTLDSEDLLGSQQNRPIAKPGPLRPGRMDASPNHRKWLINTFPNTPTGTLVAETLLGF
jgi:alpha-1,3-glucan synthase